MPSNKSLKFAPSGRWDAPSARPLAVRYPIPMPLSISRQDQIDALGT